MSTQFGFGAILNELGQQKSALAERIVTTSPDVTVSTNLGPWVNRRGLFARESMADTFKSERIPSTFNWEFSPKGQHIELGIAEMNLFIALSALGLSHSINDGAYWLREPGPNCQVVGASTGAVAPEAIQAVGLMAEDRRDLGLLAVTSADRLNAGWTAALRARERGLVHARSHIERLFD